MPLEMYQEKKLTIIGIAAGKGGVGKSSITVHLARALQQKGMQVGILDADLYGPSIRKMIPEDRLPAIQNGTIIPAYAGGFRTISLAFFKNEGAGALVRAPIANKLIKQFIHETNWGSIDVLLIDFPPGTGDIQLTLAQEASLTGALMVTTPQQVATMDVKKAADLFAQVKIPLLGVVENMSYYQTNQEKLYLFGKGEGEKLAQELGAPYFGEIPIDPEISMASDRGLPLTNQSKAIFEKLAEQIEDQLSVISNKQYLTGFELIWR